MYLRALVVPCMLLTMLAPFAAAKPRHTKIPKNAQYKRVTGAKNFKYKSPKVQKNTHKH